MALTDFNGLKSAIALWSKRDDVTDFLDDFISLAENDIDKSLQLRTNEKRALATINNVDRFIVLPTGFIEMRSLRILVGSDWEDVMFRVPDSLNIKETAGTPYFYTINKQIEFDRVPDKSYQLEMVYYKKLTPLSITNTTNNVLTDYPDVYLYGSLAHLYRWARDEQNASYYDNFFNQSIARANMQEKRGRYGASPQIALPTGEVP